MSVSRIDRFDLLFSGVLLYCQASLMFTILFCFYSRMMWSKLPLSPRLGVVYLLCKHILKKKLFFLAAILYNSYWFLSKHSTHIVTGLIKQFHAFPWPWFSIDFCSHFPRRIFFLTCYSAQTVWTGKKWRTLHNAQISKAEEYQNW